MSDVKLRSHINVYPTWYKTNISIFTAQTPLTGRWLKSLYVYLTAYENRICYIWIYWRQFCYKLFRYCAVWINTGYYTVSSISASAYLTFFLSIPADTSTHRLVSGLRCSGSSLYKAYNSMRLHVRTFRCNNMISTTIGTKMFTKRGTGVILIWYLQGTSVGCAAYIQKVV
jgi:hypothetical protein